MMEAVVEAASQAVPTRVDHPLLLRGAYCYAAAVVVVVSIISSTTNTTKVGAKPKQNKSTSAGITSALTLRRMAVVRTAVGARVGNRRLRCWTARRASKMPAFIFADVFPEQQREQEQMND